MYGSGRVKPLVTHMHSSKYLTLGNSIDITYLILPENFESKQI